MFVAVPAGANAQPADNTEEAALVEGLYSKADHLLKKWCNWPDKDVLQDARQEMALAALRGKDMRKTLQTFMDREKRLRGRFTELPEGL